MLVKMLRCKLHRATVTECDLHYQGSLKIDSDLIRAAMSPDIVPLFEVPHG